MSLFVGTTQPFSKIANGVMGYCSAQLPLEYLLGFFLNLSVPFYPSMKL